MVLCAEAVTTAGVTGGDVGGVGVVGVDVVGATGAGGGGVGVESVDVVWAGVVVAPCCTPGSWLTTGGPLDGATGGSLLIHASTAR
jgi:hypothetical protein